MKKLPIAVITAFAACAGPAVADETFQVGSDMAGAGRLRTVVNSDGQRVEVVRSANDCAPFESKAVWGRYPSADPIGYVCFHNTNR